jgi:hypothetical protein
MADRELMPAAWLRYLRQRLDERENEIVHNMLQAPDYPPLPECPTCGAKPEQITDRPTDLDDDAGLLIDFSPCGHGFKVSAFELLRG